MWLNEQVDDIFWIPKPRDDEISSALLGFPVDRLLEIQAYCLEPRTTKQIKENFASLEVDVYQLQQLGILTEGGKVGRCMAFLWSGWDADRLKAAIEHMASRPTRKINNPTQDRIDNLTEQLEKTWQRS